MSACLMLSACEGEEITIPSTQSQVVVHGVLTRVGLSQMVILERTLSGATPARIITWGGVNPFDVPTTDGGIAERFASIELDTPDGQTIVGVELAALPLAMDGAGMYRLPIAGSAIIPGGTYRLRIRLASGDSITAHTTVPNAATAPNGPVVQFNRVNDTLSLSWPAVAGARGYQVRFESPYGPWVTFTDKTSLKVNGSIRNIFAARFPSVFIPGYRQTATVSVVDSNMYDYYRTSNDGFTGVGIINNVKGGLGVFGSLVTVARQQVEVTAPRTQPIEGTFQLITGPQGYPYGGFADAATIKVYIEAPATKAGQLSAVSVGYHRTSGSYGGGAVGTWSGTQLKIIYQNGTLVYSDTVDRYTAELRGDTITGKFFKGAPAIYVRVP